MAGGGGLLLSVGAAVQGLGWNTGLYTNLYIAGLTLVLIGLVWSGIGWFFPQDTHPVCNCRVAASDEIPALLKFAESHMGPFPQPTEEYLRGLLAANRELYYIVERQGSAPSATLEIVGCFTIVPLKQGAVDRLARGEMRGSEIQRGHITQRKGTAKAFYVGIVIGADKRSSAATLRHLQNKIDLLCKKHRTVQVFATPVTNDGLRLAKRNRFRNVLSEEAPEMNVVCCRQWESKFRR